MDSENGNKILEYIELCHLRQFNKNFEESRIQNEFELWEKDLSTYCPKVVDLINNFDLSNAKDEITLKVVSSLLILQFELQSNGPWKIEKCYYFATRMNHQFELVNNTSLDKLLLDSKYVNSQGIFDKTIELLHKRLTKDDFKKYPALIQVYVSIVKDVKKYNVTLRPRSVLPVSLFLIDDYVNENKIIGLKCCSAILACLTLDHFHEGNYYEVIYGVLKKTIYEKDNQITELALECLFNLFKVLPNHAKVSTIDDMLHTVLEQLYTETNLHKKKIMFTFINKIFPIHGVACGKKIMFLTVICDNLDVCSNETVADILLTDVLECLKNWIKYCWCIWRLKPNIKILSMLIKLLYIYCANEAMCVKIQIVLITLFKLCSNDECKEIYDCLEKAAQDMKSLNSNFVRKIEVIKKELVV